MKKPQSLQDYAMDCIRRNIQDGVYPVKSKLAPQHIAAELNISPTPVVAALNRLVTQGLVEIIPRRGFIVKGFSTEDILNYFDARVMMECWAATAAVQNVRKFPEKIEELKDLAYQLDHVDLRDLATIGALESRFHLLLIQMADNEQLTRLYEFNWSCGSVFFVYSVGKVSPKNFQISLSEHRQILEQLLSGNPQKLQAMIKRHLRFLNKAIGWYNEDGHEQA